MKPGTKDVRLLVGPAALLLAVSARRFNGFSLLGQYSSGRIPFFPDLSDP